MKSRNFWFTLYTILLIGLVFIFLTEINVENTKALSPIGISSEDNFQMVSSEFGKDFENFIQDKAKVKIYDEEDGRLIKFGDVNLKIKKKSEFLEGIKEKIINITESLDTFISENIL
ncbi:hypothetical protein [Clostridium thermobutyricum]|uniref:Uncharacterized protein n=1 Tax=Clostridium thermobutyricum DSM 4928 TaxID=1121339 RepID=A0A1V4SN77_9CLOT|nr:hypothetical protein [Clostridium thermobutyricum]OPX45300.1 hypothetical protein CLTHE_30640 [Clostridium thermobutyricum DSM 4928]